MNDAAARPTFTVASSPEQLTPLITQRFAAGDMDAVADLYLPDAVFVPAPGSIVRGRDAVLLAMISVRAAGVRVHLELRRIHIVGDVALFSNSGTITGLSPDGADMHVTTAQVAVRCPDGAWRYRIDDPFWSS